MTQLESLNKSHHRNVKIDLASAKSLCADQRMMPVVLSEFLKLSIQYPILLTKDEETGQFVAVALCGFEDSDNLFWQDGQWNAVYTPLNVRRHPFFVGANEHKKNEQDHDYIICINMTGPGVYKNNLQKDSLQENSLQENSGQALFDDGGQETSFLKEMQSVLGSLIDGEIQTQKFINALLELKLVTPVSLDITFTNQQKIRAEGLYSIDEDKLKSLDTAQIAQLHKSDYLGPIYTMIASLGQIYALIQKKNAQLKSPSKWFQKAEN